MGLKFVATFLLAITYGVLVLYLVPIDVGEKEIARYQVITHVVIINRNVLG